MRLPCRTILLVAFVLLLSIPVFARGGRGRGAKMPRFTDTMSAGDVAFSVPLETLDEKDTYNLLESGGKPVVLVFGSYT